MTLRFSPRFGFLPVNRAFANSNAATAALAGPSHISARSNSTRITRLLLVVPLLFGPLGVLAYEGATRQGEVDLLFWIHECEANLRVPMNFVILQTAPTIRNQMTFSSRSSLASKGLARKP